MLPRKIVLAALLAVAPGCATRRVAVESNPPGALVRVDGMERHTPCVLQLSRGRHDIEVSLDTGRVYRARAPRPPGLWPTSARVIGVSGAYVLYAVSAPFILVGTVSTALIGATLESGMTASCEEDAAIALVLVVGAAGGLGVGLPLRAAGEFLDDVSEIEAPVVFVDFTAPVPP